MSAMPPSLNEKVTKSVIDRTGRRVIGLAVELVSGRIVLKGKADSFHVKQLAQTGVRDLLPDMPLRNEIAVVC